VQVAIADFPKGLALAYSQNKSELLALMQKHLRAQCANE
jgi:hypothetical protein